MIPALPTEALRDAIAADEWELAAQLLAQHEHAMRSALAQNPPRSDDAQQPWLALLSAQRAMLEELRVARDETARQLQQLQQDKRGVKAYLDGA